MYWASTRLFLASRCFAHRPILGRSVLPQIEVLGTRFRLPAFVLRMALVAFLADLDASLEWVLRFWAQLVLVAEVTECRVF